MTKFIRLVFASSFACTIHFTAGAQSLSINTDGSTANPSALLDVKSTSKGVLVPRMNKTERNAIVSPATGLMVFQNAPDSIGFYYYNGSTWLWMATATTSIGWLTTGNTGTDSAINFLGTLDDKPLMLRQNNLWMGELNTNTKNYFIGGVSGINNASFYNTAMGDSALYSNVTGNTNVAIGANALTRFTGSNTVAVGYKALDSLSTGVVNSAVGYRAMAQTTTGQRNTALGYRSLDSNKTGNYNTAAGYAAMYRNTSSFGTGIGDFALGSNTTGEANTVVGSNSFSVSTTGEWNTVMGTNTMFFNTTGSYNTALGFQSLYNNRSGQLNTAVGLRALYRNDSGHHNIAVGYNSLYNHRRNGSSYNVAMGNYSLESDTSGYWNVGIGTSALRSNINSIGNTAVGTNALYNHKYNDFNTAIGYESMINDTAGFFNTAMGWRSLRYNQAGNQNTAIGVGALESTDSATGNTAIGRGAMIGSIGNTTNLGYNTVVGYYAGALMDSVELSTAIGTQAGYHNRGRENTFLGTNSGGGFSGTDLTGIENTGLGTATLTYTNTGRANTAVGLGALYANRTGSNNTAIGVRAMVNSQAASRNVAIGDSTLYSNTVNELVAIGHFAMRDNTSGVDNVAVGAFAMEANTTGSENTALGANALPVNTSGGFNTAVGANTLYYQTAATGNTAIGSNTLPNITTGGYNTALGINAMYNDTTGSLNVAIGHWALFQNRNGTNNIAIGGTKAMQENRTGNFNIAIGRTALNFNVDGDYNIAIGDSALANTVNPATGGNLAIGRDAGNINTTGTFNSTIGYGSDVVSGALTNATALGYLAQAGQSNSITLGSINGVNGALTTVNVGIGTNTPNARLHVQRNGAGGGLYQASSAMIIEDNASAYMQFSNPTASEAGILSGNAATNQRSSIIFRADSSLYFRAGGSTTRMVVDNNGFVGIGTTAPATKLHIYESTGTNVNLRVASFSTSFEPGLELIKTGGGSDWRIKTATTGNLVYSRSVDDFVTPIDEYEMSSSSFRPFTDGTNSLGLASNRWTTVYATVGAINTSDARDKENISDLNYGLKEIMKLRPVSFNWKENPQWGKKIGFIAQEVKPILNEVVQVGTLKAKTEIKNDQGNALTPNSDKLGIYYSDIIPVTVKAIQEQQQLILKQQKTIDDLLERIKKLENKKN